VKLLSGIFGLVFKMYVGVVFLVTLLFFYPWIFILISRREWRKKSFPVHIAWCWMFRILTCYWVRYRKKAPVPEGPYIIVANHASYLDIFLMYSIMPKHPFLFMGKSEILKYPLVKTLFKRLNIPVFRQDRLKAAKSFIQAKQAVLDGWSIIIFPEGGIPDEHSPQMIPFKEGAFKLAKSAHVPLVPISFTNNYCLFSDPDNLLGPARPGICEVYIHEAISKEEVDASTPEELLQRTFDIINAPIQQYLKDKTGTKA
jgi:1-acyl-sn-glycerol-3-phosphate acyltransferase